MILQIELFLYLFTLLRDLCESKESLKLIRMNKINIYPGFKCYFANTSWLMGHRVLSTAIKKQGRKRGGCIVIGRLWSWDIHWKIWQDFLV